MLPSSFNTLSNVPAVHNASTYRESVTEWIASLTKRATRSEESFLKVE